MPSPTPPWPPWAHTHTTLPTYVHTREHTHRQLCWPPIHINALHPSPSTHPKSTSTNTCVHAKSLWPCLTLCDPKDCSPAGYSVHGILQARILEWVAIPFSRGSSQPRDRTYVSYSSCPAVRFFIAEPTRKPIHRHPITPKTTLPRPHPTPRPLKPSKAPAEPQQCQAPLMTRKETHMARPSGSSRAQNQPPPPWRCWTERGLKSRWASGQVSPRRQQSKGQRSRSGQPGKEAGSGVQSTSQRRSCLGGGGGCDWAQQSRAGVRMGVPKTSDSSA